MASDLSTNMRKTTEALVYAFDGQWSAEEAVAPRAPDCEHYILPTSLGVPKRNNEQFVTWLKRIEHLITDAKVLSYQRMHVMLRRSLKPEMSTLTVAR